jgi:tRNA(fMet)-specific endonuclease VapC
MRYLIDTSSLSRAIWDDSSRLRGAVWDLGIEQIVVSVMTIVEIEYGLSRRKIPRANTIREFLAHFDALPFDAVDAREAGILRSRMETNGRPIGIIDTLIAAQALVRNLTLVTHNAGEFARVGGLRVLEL